MKYYRRLAIIISDLKIASINCLLLCSPLPDIFILSLLLKAILTPSIRPVLDLPQSALPSTEAFITFWKEKKIPFNIFYPPIKGKCERVLTEPVGQLRLGVLPITPLQREVSNL